MAAALSTLQHFQDIARSEPMSFAPHAAEPVTVSDLGRSRQSRRRYRVIVSARRLTALFDHPADRSGRVR